jgi:transcription antitermination factor NusG
MPNDASSPASTASSVPDSSIRRWFALRVRPRYEKITSAALCGKGYQEFPALCRMRRRWSDRWKEVELPLFPGYIFCRFDVCCRLPVLTTPGVLYIVGFGNSPEPLDNSEVEAIRAIIRSGLPARPWPFLRAGQRVLVEYGSLAGLEGLVVSLKKDCRLVVSVSLLQRSVAVEIDRDWIRPIQ